MEQVVKQSEGLINKESGNGNQLTKLEDGRDYKAYILNLGPDAVKKIAEYHGTSESVKAEAEDPASKKRLVVVESEIAVLSKKGRKNLSDSEFSKFMKLNEEKTKLELELENNAGSINALNVVVKDINGKDVGIKMIPTMINSTTSKFNKHTLYRFQIPNNCFIYMRKSTSLDFLKTIELVEEKK